MQRWQRVIENRKDSFHLLIQDKMGVQRGKPHNEHLKYPMSTGHRFYPEWAPRPMSLVLFEHMSNSVFSQTSEVWLSQDSIPWMPLINFLFLRLPFQVFNLGILFVLNNPLPSLQILSLFKCVVCLSYCMIRLFTLY